LHIWFSEYESDESDAYGDCPIKDFSTIRQDLIEWSHKFNISLKALSELLKILTNVCDVPTDARTLLKTPRNSDVVELGNGKFAYFGIRSKGDNLRLHIDGLPLYKSSKTQFWTIMGAFGKSRPFVIGTYCGNDKPPLQEFLKPLIQEINDKSFEVDVIICDSPARSFIKCTKYPGGYSACDRCIVRGEYVEGRVTYEQLNCSLRTNESFRNQSDEDHHTNLSPLLQLPLDMIKGFCLDYQHLVCLGVVRRILHYLMTGPFCVRVGDRDISDISEKLVSLKPFFPSDINRKPRSLREIKNWKATEFRSFLLYSGPIVLESLSETFYQHFLYLHAAIFILSHKWLCKKFLSEARAFLVKFVQCSSRVYGSTFCVYNVHSLIHLADDMERFDSLDDCSAFPFENHMKTIKRKLRSTHHPLEQFSNRTAEEISCEPHVETVTTGMKLLSRHFDGPIHEDTYTHWNQYKACYNKSVRFSVSHCDAFFFDDKFVCYRIANILSHSKETTFLCYVFKKYKSFYTTPLDSKRLNVFVVSSLSKTLSPVFLSEVRFKACVFPFRDEFVAFPLLEVC